MLINDKLMGFINFISTIHRIIPIPKYLWPTSRHRSTFAEDSLLAAHTGIPNQKKQYPVVAGGLLTCRSLRVRRKIRIE
jgi:hypothetical protein